VHDHHPAALHRPASTRRWAHHQGACLCRCLKLPVSCQSPRGAGNAFMWLKS